MRIGVDTGPASDPGGSQMQLLRDESSRKPSGNASVPAMRVCTLSSVLAAPASRALIHIYEEWGDPRGIRQSSPPAPSLDPELFPLPAPAHLRRPINPFKASWTRPIWGAPGGCYLWREERGWARARGAQNGAGGEMVSSRTKRC